MSNSLPEACELYPNLVDLPAELQHIIFELNPRRWLRASKQLYNISKPRLGYDQSMSPTERRNGVIVLLTSGRVLDEIEIKFITNFLSFTNYIITVSAELVSLMTSQLYETYTTLLINSDRNHMRGILQNYISYNPDYLIYLENRLGSKEFRISHVKLYTIIIGLLKDYLSDKDVYHINRVGAERISDNRLLVRSFMIIYRKCGQRLETNTIVHILQYCSSSDVRELLADLLSQSFCIEDLLGYLDSNNDKSTILDPKNHTYTFVNDIEKILGVLIRRNIPNYNSILEIFKIVPAVNTSDLFLTCLITEPNDDARLMNAPENINAINDYILGSGIIKDTDLSYILGVTIRSLDQIIVEQLIRPPRKGYPYLLLSKLLAYPKLKPQIIDISKLLKRYWNLKNANTSSSNNSLLSNPEYMLMMNGLFSNPSEDVQEMIRAVNGTIEVWDE